jgi:hypothetical protein
MSTCKNCPQLEAKIRTLENIIVKLQLKLDAISSACSESIGNCNSTLSQHQPRGKWAYAKGIKAMAIAIRGLAK